MNDELKPFYKSSVIRLYIGLFFAHMAIIYIMDVVLK